MVPPAFVTLIAFWKVISAPSASIAVSTPCPSVRSRMRWTTSSLEKSAITSAP